MTRIETDVAIIGGGSAGMCAAIAAREAGRRVLLVRRPGGNCTSLAAGGFAAVLPGSADDSLERHYENTLASACGLADPALVAALVEHAAEALRRVMDWGVRFYALEDGSLRRFRSGGHSAARTYRCLKGNTAQFYRVFLRRLRALGVEELPGADITRLLSAGGRVCGAAGLDRRAEPLSLRARAVVLATGGFAGCYGRTTNPRAMTGEGCVMAYEAGCTLSDLEFVQFMPTAFAFPPEMAGRIVNDTLRGEGAVLRDGQGRRFMDRYDPVYEDCAGRDILAIAIAAETAAGRGTPHGGVYLDARGVAPAAMARSFGDMGRLLRCGLDPARDLIEVSPAAHFTCGGVRIDASCRTGVEGLFAAGEVTAGLHGANRLGANALSETLVFGEAAGRAAAQYAAACPAAPNRVDDDRAAPAGPEDTNPQEREEEVRRLFQETLGVIRGQDALKRGAARLAEIAVSGRIARGASPRDAARAERVRKMALLGHLAATAALCRAESRGNHSRSDFPRPDAAQQRHIEFRAAAEAPAA